MKRKPIGAPAPVPANFARHLCRIGGGAGLLSALVACGGGGGGSGTTGGGSGGGQGTTYQIGGTVSALSGSLGLADNGSDTLTVTASGAFSFPTRLASGQAYAVTVAQQPAGQTCTVTQGTGTVGTADVSNVVVACSKTMSGTRTMYLDAGLGTIMRVSLGADGTASAVDETAMCSSTPLAGEGNSFGESLLAISPDGRALFNSSFAKSEVCSYEVAANGSLAPTNPAFAAASLDVSGTAVTADGRWLYADDPQGSFDVYGIGAGGVLTGVPASDIPTLTAGAYLDGVEASTLNHDGTVLYALLEGGPPDGNGCLHFDVVLFDVGSDGAPVYRPGAAQPVASACELPDPAYLGDVIRLNASGTALYVPDEFGGVIHEFAVASDGSLSPLSSPTIGAGAGASVIGSVLVAPDGRGVYAIDIKNNLIWQFTADATGVLSPQATATVQACPTSGLFQDAANPMYADFDGATGILWLSCTQGTGVRSMAVGADESLSVLKDTPLGSELEVVLPETFVIAP